MVVLVSLILKFTRLNRSRLFLVRNILSVILGGFKRVFPPSTNSLPIRLGMGGRPSFAIKTRYGRLWVGSADSWDNGSYSINLPSFKQVPYLAANRCDEFVVVKKRTRTRTVRECYAGEACKVSVRYKNAVTACIDPLFAMCSFSSL